MLALMPIPYQWQGSEVFRNDDGVGSENVISKMNSRSFKLRPDCSMVCHIVNFLEVNSLTEDTQV